MHKVYQYFRVSMAPFLPHALIRAGMRGQRLFSMLADHGTHAEHIKNILRNISR